jgi:hypothetical protein
LNPPAISSHIQSFVAIGFLTAHRGRQWRTEARISEIRSKAEIESQTAGRLAFETNSFSEKGAAVIRLPTTRPRLHCRAKLPGSGTQALTMPSFSAPHFEPFSDQPRFRLKDAAVTGPLGALNPTRARYGYVTDGIPAADQAGDAQTADGLVAPGVEFKWRSRDNRKGKSSSDARDAPPANKLADPQADMLSRSTPIWTPKPRHSSFHHLHRRSNPL